MAYDLENLAQEIDRHLRDGQISLKHICATLGIHRHTADRALHQAFGGSFRQRREFWQLTRFETLTKDQILSGKELAGRLGYANYFNLKRRCRQLGIPIRTRRRAG